MKCENCNNGPARVIVTKLNNETVCLCDRCANGSGTRYPFEIERCKIRLPGLHPIPALCYTEEGEKSRIKLHLRLPDNFVPRKILNSED